MGWFVYRRSYSILERPCSMSFLHSWFGCNFMLREPLMWNGYIWPHSIQQNSCSCSWRFSIMAFQFLLKLSNNLIVFEMHSKNRRHNAPVDFNLLFEMVCVMEFCVSNREICSILSANYRLTILTGVIWLRFNRN